MSINLENGNLKVLITGGAGFIGGTLVRRLINCTNSTVFNLDKLSYASNLDGIDKQANSKNHILMKVDLVNFQDTINAVRTADPDIILHLAAESHVDRSIENATPFLESNVIGTFNILESARLHWNNLKSERKDSFRFLHVSTDEVFGSLGETGRFSEKTAYDPRSPYSATKAASDHLANAWHHTFNLPIIKTNCSNNFGPYQFPEKLIPLVIQKGINRSKIPLYGDGKNVRDWIFVEDHVDALILAIKYGRIGSHYCIGGDNEKTNLEIVDSICDILDLKLPSQSPFSKLIELVEDRPGHDRRYSIDSSLIKRDLGWEKRHNFQEALLKTVEWYLDNQNWCEKIKKQSDMGEERIGLINKLKKPN